MVPSPMQQEEKSQTTMEPKAPYFYYRDHSHLRDPDPTKPVTIPGRIPTFPAKLFAILSRPDLADIISWMPHGRSWKVHKPREFEVKVIPSYFDHAKFSSFIRQANGWGFKRVTTKGTDRNSHYHELFLRGMPHLIKFMKRPVSGSKALQQPQHAKGKNCDPNFYKISDEHPLPEMAPKMIHPLDEGSFLNSAKNSQITLGPSFNMTHKPHTPVSGPSTAQGQSMTQLQAFFAEQDKQHQQVLAEQLTPGQSNSFLLPRTAPQHEVTCPIRLQEKDLDPLTILLEDFSEEHAQIDDPIIQSLVSDPSVPPPSSLNQEGPIMYTSQAFSPAQPTAVSPAEEKPVMHFSHDMPEPEPVHAMHDDSIFEDPFAGGIMAQDFF